MSTGSVIDMYPRQVSRIGGSAGEKLIAIKQTQNFISFLNIVNEGDNLRFQGSKLQSWLALQDTEFNPYLLGGYASAKNIKLSCIIDICSGREYFVYYFLKKVIYLYTSINNEFTHL